MTYERIVFLGGIADGQEVADDRRLPELYHDGTKTGKLVFAVYERTERFDSQGRRIYSFVETRKE